jgi:hypothetical protein
VIVEGDDLTIDDRPLRARPCRRLQEPAEVARCVLRAAGPQADPPVVDDGLDAEAVPLDLELGVFLLR